MANVPLEVVADSTKHGSRQVLATTTPGTQGTIPITGSNGELDPSYAGKPRVQSIRETHLMSTFTDGLGATATKAMTGELPVGATVFATRLQVPVACDGDGDETDCKLTIGDGVDVDRFNTGTPSIFTAAAAGVQTGLPSGDALIVTAVAPVLTITASGGDADATDIINGGGRVNVEIDYIERDA